jgi:hypothetical protein
MRASEIRTFQFRNTVLLTDWCFKGATPEVACYLNESTDVAFQLWAEAGKYRHTDPLHGHPRQYGDWKQLTPESGLST